MNEKNKTMTISLAPTKGDKNLNDYIKQVRAIDRLEAEEEQKLVKLKEQGDLDATRRLIEGHLWLVIFFAKRYKGYRLSTADLIQEGNIGLMKGVKKFDSSHAVRVSSYVHRWITSEMNDYVIKNLKSAKIATNHDTRKLFFKLGSRKPIGRKSFTQQEIADMSEEFGIKEKTIREMEIRLVGTACSFDRDMAHDKLDGNQPKLPSSFIASPVNTPLQLLEHDDTNQHHTIKLKSAIDALPPRSQDIIAKRWLDEDNTTTLRELSDEYGVSMERIRQIETQAISRIREHMEY